MTIEEFKELDPNSYGDGNINLLFSSSVIDPGIDNTPIAPYVIQGLAVPFTSVEGTNISEVLRGITEIRFTFDGTVVDAKITGKQRRTGYYYYTVEDFPTNSLPAEVEGVGYVQNETFPVFIPYSTTNFNNSDYNPTLNNSEGSKANDIAQQVDRFTSQILPTNLDAIIAGTANPAELQNCSYTKIPIISSRYLGSKTTGAGPNYTRNKERRTAYVQANLIPGNSPSLSFKQFNGSTHPSDADTTTIKNILQADRELTQIYFNVERQKVGSEFVFPNFPYSGSFIYTEQGNKLIKVVNSKLYSIDKGEVYTTNEFGGVTLVE